MLGFRSYRTKLQIAFLLLGLAAIGTTGWQISVGASNALRQATFDRLTAIRETRVRQIERYFEDVANHVLALSTDESTVAALEQFRNSWESIPPLGPAQSGKLLDYYTRAGNPRGGWIPSDPRVRSLQYSFLAANPHPAGSKDLLLSAPELGPYSQVHARYHPTLHRYLTAFGFYDIFLIDARDGRILYTVLKEADIGFPLTKAPYQSTSFSRAFSRAMALPEPERWVIEDYAPYVASNHAPAAFLAAPIWRAGAKIGVLAIQVSVSEVNRVMTGDRHWTEEGLGKTGQAYIVGSDGTLRSDLRVELEHPEEYYLHLEQAGVKREVVNRIRRYRTAILNLPVGPHLAETLRSRHRGTGIGRDFFGVEVFRSQTPLDVPGLDWSLVAEVESNEALEPVRALQSRILWIGLLTAAIFFLAARLLASSVTRPVLALAGSARRLGSRDFGVRIPVESSDEVGQLAESFNRMAEELERTTVSKEELDRLLGSLINAVFVVGAEAGSGAAGIAAAPIRLANRAAVDLLGYGPDELEGRAFGDLLPDAGIVERVAATGRQSATETALRRKDGSAVPVLFTAAILREQAGRSSGIVCAAQDISAWKAAQDQLRRLSKVFMDSADPIVVANLHGHISDCNDEAERVYLWQREELIGKPLSALAPPANAVQLEEYLAQCLGGVQLRNMQTVLADRTGHDFPALLTMSLLTGEKGRPTGVAAIAKDITAHKQAEETLRQKQVELETLAGRLITAQEEERSRLARELHDDLTQRLAAVAIEAGRLEQVLPADAASHRKTLERIKQQMAALSDDIHGLSRRLHPSTLDDLGLLAAIESECRSFFERGGAPVHFTFDGNFDSAPKETQLGLYRIVQEALRNIQKHAAAEEISIHLQPRNGNLELEIRDDGRGFDPKDPEWRPGLGLASMEERARLLGGRVQIVSRPAQGTTITVTVPNGECCG